MDEAELTKLTVAELKAILNEQGLPVSGKKSDLIERLSISTAPPMQETTLAPPMMVVEEDVVVFDEPITLMARMKTPLYGSINMGMAIAIGLAALMVSAVLIVQPAWLGFEPDYDYELIDFDANQAQMYAENLVALGHPDWEGRMSGTRRRSKRCPIHHL